MANGGDSPSHPCHRLHCATDADEIMFSHVKPFDNSAAQTECSKVISGDGLDAFVTLGSSECVLVRGQERAVIMCVYWAN